MHLASSAAAAMPSAGQREAGSGSVVRPSPRRLSFTKARQRGECAGRDGRVTAARRPHGHGIVMAALLAVCVTISGLPATQAAEDVLVGPWNPDYRTSLRRLRVAPEPRYHAPGGVGEDSSQFAALNEMWSGLGGAEWTRANNWRLTTDYCSFEGVLCDAQGNVVVLELSSNNMHGSLSNEMFRFPNLVVLDMSENFIAGTIPEGVFNVTTLKVLDFSTNFLTGGLSASVAQLRHLHRFHVADNRLTGSIPDGLAELTEAYHVLLGANRFTGTVVQDWQPAQRLRTLSLVNNMLSGPMPNVSLCRELQYLDVSWNMFTGPIVPLDNLVHLETLRLNNNALSGVFPPAITSMLHLSTLHMENNMLSCALPDFSATFLAQFGGPANFSILEANRFDCPVPPTLDHIDPQFQAYYCGDGVERFYVAGACSLLFVIAAVAHTCPWYGPNKPKTASLHGLGTYAPGREASTYIEVVKSAVIVLVFMCMLSAGLMLIYSTSTSPYSCRYLLSVSAGYVSESPTLVVGLLHFFFLVAILGWLSCVRRNRRATWGVWPEPETWLPLLDPVEKRRCSLDWVFKKTKFALLCIVLFLTLSLIPNIIYAFVRSQSDVSLFVKRAAGIVIAAYTAVINVNLSGKFAQEMMQRYFSPRSLKHRFEVQVRLAAWFVVIHSLISPWLASVLMQPDCLFHYFVPRPTMLVPVDEKVCTEFSSTGDCVEVRPAVDYIYIVPDWQWDTRCPTQVLELYGSVWIAGLVFQGMLGTAFRLFEDRFKVNPGFRRFAIFVRRYLCFRNTSTFGTASQTYLHGLVSRYSQIIDNLGVVVVFGSVFPLVVPVGLVAMAGRGYADYRLISKGMADNSHRAWEPQGARGLPTSAIVLILVVYCFFLAFFFGAGMVPSALYWAFLLPVTIFGLVMVWLNAPDYIIRCCDHVSETTNSRPRVEQPPWRAPIDPAADEVLISGEKLAESTAEVLISRPRAGSAGSGRSPSPSFSPDGEPGVRVASSDGLTGVGGRPIQRDRTPNPREILDKLSLQGAMGIRRGGEDRDSGSRGGRGMPTLKEESDSSLGGTGFYGGRGVYNSAELPGSCDDAMPRRSSSWAIRPRGRRTGGRRSGASAAGTGDMGLSGSAPGATSRAGRWLLDLDDDDDDGAGAGAGGEAGAGAGGGEGGDGGDELGYDSIRTPGRLRRARRASTGSATGHNPLQVRNLASRWLLEGDPAGEDVGADDEVAASLDDGPSS